jgi:hypothetical protein
MTSLRIRTPLARSLAKVASRSSTADVVEPEPGQIGLV